jgi:hypothetical protein
LWRAAFGGHKETRTPDLYHVNFEVNDLKPFPHLAFPHSKGPKTPSKLPSFDGECGKQIASYLGLVPLEESSGQRRRLGHITKQGNSLMRFLLVEAAQVTVRSVPEWRSKYFHLVLRRGRKIAKVAMARRLAVRLYWMMRQGWDYQQWSKFGSHAEQPGHRHGVQ